jgi:hypothetical protein
MCGLLGISACHLAFSSGDIAARETHRERAAAFGSRYLEWQCGSSPMMSSSNDVEVKNAGDRVACILQCAIWTLCEATYHGGIEPTQSNNFNLQSFTIALRNLSQTDNICNEYESQETVFAKAKMILESKTPDSYDLSGAGHALLTRLRLLPSQLSSAFGRPDDVQDVLATLSAIAALVVCCEASFATNEAWEGMTRWLTMITEHFHNMISASKPAALVLIAYWALLAKQAQDSGFWFLKDVAEKVWREVSERLEAGDCSVMRLVADLRD